MITLYQSNCMNELARALTEKIQCDMAHGNVFESVKIICQTKGIQTFLQQFIAQNCGVCAHVEFAFLGDFIRNELESNQTQNSAAEEALRRKLRENGVLFEPIKQCRTSQKEMKERLYSTFTQNPQAYAHFSSYLNDTQQTPLRRWELSGMLAERFDLYQAHVPLSTAMDDFLRDVPELAALYQHCVRAPDMRASVAAFDPEKSLLSGRQIYIFGISDMPPLFWAFLKKLGSVCAIDYFYRNVSPYFWGDYDAAAGRFLKRLHAEVAPENGDGCASNVILNNCANAAREFFTELDASTQEPLTPVPFHEPRADTLLGAFQKSIFCNTTQVETKWKNDETLRIVTCPGPRREIETLHDYLLDIMQKNPKIELRDIVVCAPNIESYEAYIDLVFGAKESPFRGAYTLADRSFKSAGHVGESLLLLLNLAVSRFTVTDVFALLQRTCVRSCAGLSAAAVERLRELVLSVSICWGIDAPMREKVAGKPYAAFSWRAGLDRLYAGELYAPNGAPFDAPVVPKDAFDDPETLASVGRLENFIQALHKLGSELQEPKTPLAWKTFLREISGRFIALTDDAARDEYNGMNLFFNSLGSMDTNEKLPIEIIRTELDSFLSSRHVSGAFMRGKITFCTLMPMRAVPVKVAALLGLNSGLFPSHAPYARFGLRGKMLDKFDSRMERQREREARYLFLETLLSPSDALILSSSNLAQKGGNAEPCTMLSEVIDYLKLNTENFAVIEQRRHLYDAAYFTTDSPLFSYNTNAYTIVKKSFASAPAAPTLYTGFDESYAVPERVSLFDFERCLTDPIAFHLQELFGYTQAYDDPMLSADEPFRLGGLASFDVRKRLIRAHVEQRAALEAALAYCHRANMLPLPPFDQATRKEMEKLYSVDCGALRDKLLAQTMHAFELNVDGILLYGEVSAAESEGGFYSVETRYAAQKAKDIIRTLVRHAVRNVCLGPCASTFYGFPENAKNGYEVISYACVDREKAFAYLQYMMAHFYRESFKRMVPFFAEEGLDYARSKRGKALATPYNLQDRLPLNVLMRNGNLSAEQRDECCQLSKKIFSMLTSETEAQS